MTAGTHDSGHDATATLRDVNSQQRVGTRCYPPQVSILKSSIREEESRIGVDGTDVTREEQLSSFGPGTAAPLTTGRSATNAADGGDYGSALTAARNERNTARHGRDAGRAGNRSLSPGPCDAEGHATERPPPRKEASHVGVLKVPESLAGRAVENLVEHLASSPGKKGAGKTIL